MPETFAGLKVMVADDEEFVHVIMRRILGALGIHSVEEALSGQEALSKMEQSCPDLMFLDIVMEPMDGIELLKRMREHPIDAIRRLPVIVLTLNSDAEMVNNVMPYGIDAYLVKPVTPDVLRAKIGQVIAAKGARK